MEVPASHMVSSDTAVKVALLKLSNCESPDSSISLDYNRSKERTGLLIIASEGGHTDLSCGL